MIHIHFAIVGTNWITRQFIEALLFSYCQYSSCYQRDLDGENPNTFNPRWSNGSIMDIGYCCLATSVMLWGAPAGGQSERDAAG